MPGMRAGAPAFSSNPLQTTPTTPAALAPLTSAAAPPAVNLTLAPGPASSGDHRIRLCSPQGAWGPCLAAVRRPGLALLGPVYNAWLGWCIQLCRPVRPFQHAAAPLHTFERCVLKQAFFPGLQVPIPAPILSLAFAPPPEATLPARVFAPSAIYTPLSPDVSSPVPAVPSDLAPTPQVVANTPGPQQLPSILSPLAAVPAMAPATSVPILNPSPGDVSSPGFQPPDALSVSESAFSWASLGNMPTPAAAEPCCQRAGSTSAPGPVSAAIPPTIPLMVTRELRLQSRQSTQQASDKLVCRCHCGGSLAHSDAGLCTTSHCDQWPVLTSCIFLCVPESESGVLHLNTWADAAAMLPSHARLTACPPANPLICTLHLGCMCW